MKTLKKGGELLGKGAYGCVFNIEFPCRKKKHTKRVRGEKYVSKIFFHNNAIKEAKKEYKINNLVRKIKGNKKWCILWKRLCKPSNYREIYRIDPSIKGCLRKTKLTPEQFNKRSAMLIGKYGGHTMEKIFDTKMKTVKTKNEFMLFFLRTMKRLLPLFLGIKTLNDNNLVHSDIKKGNIVLDDKSYKLIDFGLAAFLDDHKTYKLRSMRQFFDERIYTPYPIDYIYAFTDGKQNNMEYEAYKNKDYRENIDEYINIHEKIFKRKNIKENILHFLKNNKSNSKKIYDTLDVYSLGYLIPKTFYSSLYLSAINMDTLIQYFDDPLLKPFIMLFKDMTRETFFKEGDRIDSKEAYLRFKDLVENIKY